MFGVPRNIHRIPRVGECLIWVVAMGRVHEHNLSDVALACLRSRTHTQAHIEASLSSNRRILQMLTTSRRLGERSLRGEPRRIQVFRYLSNSSITTNTSTSNHDFATASGVANRKRNDSLYKFVARQKKVLLAILICRKSLVSAFDGVLWNREKGTYIL